MQSRHLSEENMGFTVDERITSSCRQLIDWPLSRVLLKNNAHYPWLILVPRIRGIQDIDELSRDNRNLLMEEISSLSLIVRAQFTPDKINVGALGNKVSQLHIHVVARFKSDPLWPEGIWQASQTELAYPIDEYERLSSCLSGALSMTFAENKPNPLA